MKREALLALRGVGDAHAGEWTEIGDVAVHVRRRLSAEDLVQLPVEHRTVVDVRGEIPEDHPLVTELNEVARAWRNTTVEDVLRDYFWREMAGEQVVGS